MHRSSECSYGHSSRVTIHTPLYFVGEEKPTEGTDVLVAIYDNKTSTLGDGVTVKTPGENGTSEFGGCQHIGDKKYSLTNNKKHTKVEEKVRKG